MSDQMKAFDLGVSDPHRTWDSIVSKYFQTHSGDRLYELIYKKSMESRASVNAKWQSTSK